MSDLKERARQVVEAYNECLAIRNAYVEMKTEEEMFDKMADQCEVEEAAEAYRNAWAYLGTLQADLDTALSKSRAKLDRSISYLDEELEA